MAGGRTVKEVAMDAWYLLLIAILYGATDGLTRALARLGDVE